MFKYFSFLVIGLFAINTAMAQRVKRKGTEPLMRGPKQETAKGQYSLEQLTGKWQEIKRMNRKKNEIAIEDTVYLTFSEGGRVETKDGNKTTMRGSAQIDVDNVLIVASDVYTIKGLTEAEMFLDDDETYIRKFKKVDRFSFEGFGKDSVNKEEYKEVDITIDDVLGKWMVYRKQAKPGAINPPTNIISYLKITEKITDSTAKGTVVFYQTPDKSEEIPCEVKVNKGNIEVTSGTTYFWRLFTYKADKKEFVFGSTDVLLYFAKLIP